MVDLTEFGRQLAAFKRPAATPGTRVARIEAFYDLLHELPSGSHWTIEQTEEAMRLSGMTDLDFRALYAENELAAQRDEAMADWHAEQDSAWRQNIIAVLTHWDDMTETDRQTCIVAMRDLFQRLAGEGEVLPLPSGPQIDPNAP